MEEKKLICPVERIKTTSVDLEVDLQEDTMNVKVDVTTKNIVKSIIDFNINYKEDGTIEIDIDTKTLESTIAKAVIDALENYIKTPDAEIEHMDSEINIPVDPARSEFITRNNTKAKTTWFHNTSVGANDGVIEFISFPGDLTISFEYDEDDNIKGVFIQGQLHNIKTIGKYILTFDILR